MVRVSHAPHNYECPFCSFIDSYRVGAEQTDSLLKFSDVVIETKLSLVFSSIKWWPNNPGHVLIVPKTHFENIYDIPADHLADIAVLSKKLAVAMKQAFSCHGTSTRQHNEPAGYQDVWHFHQHVFPRWSNDNLYFEKGRLVSCDERLPYMDKLREAVRG